MPSSAKKSKNRSIKGLEIKRTALWKFAGFK